MIVVFIVILLAVVVIFGVSSGMQSYATAQQAQAQIETARVAQVNAWGNVLTILAVITIVIVAMLLIAAVIWVMYRRSLSRKPRAVSQSPDASAPALPAGKTLEMLLQMKMLELLMDRTQPRNLLDTPREEQAPVDDLFPWLR